jgi:Leucine-rich repeat (LRR) protein
MDGFHIHKGQKLQWLAIAYNKLSSPVGIRDLANLTYLNLGNNGLTTLKGLEGLPQLTTLILKENKLERVEELSLFPELRTVELQANNITELPNLENPKIITRIEDNPVSEAWEKAQASASATPPGHIPGSSPPRTLTLPSGGGTLSSWGTARKKYVNPFKGKKRFNVYKNGISLNGVHRLDVLPSAFNGCLARVKISVSRGKVRVYLKAPYTSRYMEDRFGNQRLERVSVPGYVYATATPEQSRILLGLLMSTSYGPGQIVLESVDGSASGISYEVTDTYSD